MSCARIIQVIETDLLVRAEPDGSRLRIVRQYWTLAGELLAENDPLVTGQGPLVTIVEDESKENTGD